MCPPYIYPYASGAASCKSQQEKITQLENTFLGIKFVFFVELFFRVDLFFLVDFLHVEAALA